MSLESVFAHIKVKLTDKKLLQLFVTIINAKLFEAIRVEDFEAVDVEHADHRSISLHTVVDIVHIDRVVHARHYPREQSFVYSLRIFVLFIQ